MRRLAQLLGVVLVTAALLAYALADLDLAMLRAHLAAADASRLVPFQLCLVLFFWLKARRWAYLMVPLARFETARVVPAMMIGFAGNNVLPARIGEVLRVLVFVRQSGQPVSGVATSVALERILNLLALLGLYLLALPFLEHVPARLAGALGMAGMVACLALAGVLALAWRPGIGLRTWERLFRWLPEQPRTLGRRVLEEVIHVLGTARSGSRLALAYGNSLAQWVLMTGMIWLSLDAVGIQAGPAAAVLVLVATAVASAAFSAPGYIGATQAAFVFALGSLDGNREMAFAASVLYVAAQWIPVTAVGLVFWVAHLRARSRPPPD